MKNSTPPPEIPLNSDKTPTVAPVSSPAKPEEIGGPKGPEPTRYGDWERNGRVSDF